MKLLFRSFSLLSICFIVVGFQFLHLFPLLFETIIDARLLNVFMLITVISLYFLSILRNKSVMNRFQVFISIAIFYEWRNVGDFTGKLNIPYLILFLIYSLIALYDIFYIKKDYGKYFFDFVLIKNWF